VDFGEGKRDRRERKKKEGRIKERKGKGREGRGRKHRKGKKVRRPLITFATNLRTLAASLGIAGAQIIRQETHQEMR